MSIANWEVSYLLVSLWWNYSTEDVSDVEYELGRGEGMNFGIFQTTSSLIAF